MELHILNGDCCREVFEKAGIPGEIHVLREMLLESPFELNCDWDDLFEMRADWLHSNFGIPVEDYLNEKNIEFDLIERLNQYDSVYFWFDTDLFCQLNLIYALSWFASESPPHASLHLVTPRIVRDERTVPLSMLQPSDYSELLRTASIIRPADVDLADAALIAFGAESPQLLTKWMRSLCPQRLSGLPDLKPAIDSLFSLFPSPLDGLGLTERLILTGIPSATRNNGSDGITLADLVKRILSNSDAQQHGMTDLLLYFHLRSLARGVQPLIAITGLGEWPDFRKPLSDQEALRIRCVRTQAGDDVLAAKTNRLSIQSVDRWIGGVHLCPANGFWSFDGVSFQHRR